MQYLVLAPMVVHSAYGMATMGWGDINLAYTLILRYCYFLFLKNIQVH
jgi:hypothetical protein